MEWWECHIPKDYKQDLCLLLDNRILQVLLQILVRSQMPFLLFCSWWYWMLLQSLVPLWFSHIHPYANYGRTMYLCQWLKCHYQHLSYRIIWLPLFPMLPKVKRYSLFCRIESTLTCKVLSMVETCFVFCLVQAMNVAMLIKRITVFFMVVYVNIIHYSYKSNMPLLQYL